MDSDSDAFVVEGQDESFSEENSGSSSSEDDGDEEENERDWFAALQRIKENDPTVAQLYGSGENNYTRDMTDEEWEQLGRGILDNTHLEVVSLRDGALNDHKISFFFRGLTRSSSIKELWLNENELSAAGIRSMVPVLERFSYLKELCLNDNNLQSEGFNALFLALRNSSIEKLHCECCDIESIEIHIGCAPRSLRVLALNDNLINADGCRQLTKLLKSDACWLTHLSLNNNKIDDEGVEILVAALKSNKALRTLDIRGNNGISRRGNIMLLKLVNDISSIKATLRSNRTLSSIYVNFTHPHTLFDENYKIQQQINVATQINREYYYDWEAIPRAGKAKMIFTQLDSVERAELAEIQGVSHSVYSEIDPLHLPEALALVGHHHGQGELYVALSSSIMALFSTVNLKKCIQQERVYHAAKAAEHATKVEKLDAKLAMMEEEEVRNVGVSNINHRRSRVESDESCSNKRRRKWWWGLWSKTA